MRLKEFASFQQLSTGFQSPPRPPSKDKRIQQQHIYISGRFLNDATILISGRFLRDATR